MRNDKNSAILSGLVSSEISSIKNDNILFTVSTHDPQSDNTRDFKVVAFGDAATALKAKAQSGDRVVVQGRLSSEELEAESKMYHGVFQISRILAINPEDGSDYSNGELEGLASCKEVRKTGTGKSVATLNVKVSRTFKGKDGKEVTYPHYANVTLWGDRADALKSLVPFENRRITASGGLMPSEYASSKHGDAMLSKIEIWADSLSFVSEEGAVADSPAPSAPAARPARAPARKVADSDLPF
jgi:single-stranded DNA-binding protein